MISAATLQSSDRRRVLILEPSGNLWGSERVLLDFLGAVAPGAWQIGICCPPRTPILQPLSRLPVEVMPCFEANLHLQGRGARLRAALRLWQAARRFGPGLIYVNQAGATRIALLVGRLLRVPVVTHVRLAEDAAYILSLGAGRREMPKVVCISHYIRSLFPEGAAVTSEQLEVLYDPYATAHDWISEEAKPSGEPLFGCVGRLARIKGQDVLLEAVAALKEQGTRARAVFVGAAGPGDTTEAELRSQAQKLGLADQITWAGFQNDVFSVLRGSAAQVIPSRVEPLGRVLFEAWDSGTIPIAWAGSGGLAEVLGASGGGLLYEEQSGPSLARAMRRAMQLSSAERIEMIGRGRGWLRENCDPSIYANVMLSLWEQAAQGAVRGR